MQLLRNAPAPTRRRMQTTPRAAALAGEWEAGVAPMPGTFDNDPAARPVLVMVVAGGFVLSCDLENRPSEEPEALAELLARAILAAVDETGVVPSHVAIRHASLVEPLAGALEGRRIPATLRGELPELDAALRSLLGHVFNGITPRDRLRSQPETWAGWGMPVAQVARLFAAAARYYGAAPWTRTAQERPILISRAGGHAWSVIVLGAAGEQMGLACYHSADDLERLFTRDETDPASAFDALQGVVVSLLFNTRLEIPKPMREEIKAARWDVAGPEAYPTLLVMNTPGGGIRAADFALLRDALVSVPRFVEAYPQAFADDLFDEERDGDAFDDAVEWTDPETGLTCRLEPLAFDSTDVLTFYDVLAPAGPTGPGAAPEARLREAQAPTDVEETLARFRASLLAPASGKPLAEATVRKHVDNARYLVELCAHGGGRPIRAVTEYDLRTLLYDWYPRKVADTERGARALLVSLRRFFTFLRVHEGVACAWAEPLLADADAFVGRWHTCPGRFFWDERVQAWQAQHTIDLSARVLLPSRDTDSGFAFGATLGVVEHRLYLALHNAWLLWRDEVIRAGVVAPKHVVALLLQRQRQWLATPQPGSGGLSPVAAIEREREATSAR
jgi:hypothetical protein